MSEVLSGRTLASEIKAYVAQAVQKLSADNLTPRLAIMIATDDETAHFYVKHIKAAGEKTGVKVDVRELSPSASQQEMSDAMAALAANSQVHGIILQTPVPSGVQVDVLRGLIPLQKDVDGANPLSLGRLMSGLEAFAPTTAVAVMELCKKYEIALEGSRVVIIGRSLVVGKPLAHLMLEANATVTVCHSKTRDLLAVAREADLLVVAIGRPEMITAEYVKPGAMVIDVGTNVREDGSLVGDVNAASIQETAHAYTPVPGGIGPVTTALLLKQTVDAASSK